MSRQATSSLPSTQPAPKKSSAVSVGASIVDDLDCGQHGVDRLHRLRAVHVRGQITGEPNRELAFDARPAEGGMLDRACADLDQRGPDMTRRGLVDAEVLLHRRRGAADLPAGLRTLGLGQQPVQHALDLVRLVAVARTRVLGEARERPGLEPVAREHGGGPRDTVAHGVGRHEKIG
jgi:hypothetical protein